MKIETRKEEEERGVAEARWLFSLPFSYEKGQRGEVNIFGSTTPTGEENDDREKGGGEKGGGGG